MAVDASAGPGTSARTRRRDLLVLGLVAAAVRVPAQLSSRHLSFDDGVYGATSIAMRRGARPYLDVFSSQGPLHLPLVYLADLLGGRTDRAPRLLSLAAGIAITLLTYVIARRLAGRTAGLVGALLVTTSGSVLLVTTGITGDGPAIAFALGALAAALAYTDRPGPARAVAVGLLTGCALAVKLLVAPIVLPVAMLLLSRRRPRDIVVAAGSTLAFVAVVAFPWGYSRVWDQSFVYHHEARRYTVAQAAWRIVTTLVERDTLVTATALVVAGLAVTAIVRGARTAGAAGSALARPGWFLGLWLAAQVGALLTESAMWRPHVSQLVAPLCLLACLRLPSWRVLTVTWLVAAPVFLVGVVPLVRPGGYRGDDAVVARRLRALPPAAVVVTDEPGFAWRTGHLVPEGLVDTSVKRIDQRRITQGEVVADARDPRSCAVLVWSSQQFGSFPALPRRLADLGYEVADRFGNGRVLYLRSSPRCSRT